MTWLIIIVVAVVIVAAGIYGSNRRKKLIASGQIVERGSDFYRYTEIFTVGDVSFERVASAMRDTYFYNAANVSIDSSQEAVRFKGADWTAWLYRNKDETERNAYSFCFTHWEARNSIPYGYMNMNTVLTAVEKTFLNLDPNTQVSSKKNSISTKHKFF